MSDTLMLCQHCGDEFYHDEVEAHALACREAQDEYIGSLSDIAFGHDARGPFDYIDAGCLSLIKRWTFPDHVQGCQECAECLTTFVMETSTEVLPNTAPERAE